MASDHVKWKIGDALVIPTIHLIRKNGKEIRVKPRLMHLFQFLLENKGQILTKDEIIENVWADRVITENLLIKSISELRSLLDEHFDKKLILETLRNTGYRLLSEEKITKQNSNKGLENMLPEYSKKQKIWILSTITIMLFAIVFYWLIPNTDKVTEELPVRDITTLKGQEISPDISSDGQNLAFCWRNNTQSNFNVYVMGMGNSTPRKLSESNNPEFNPIWSPDGKEIIFMRRENDGQVYLIRKALIGNDEFQLAELSQFKINRGLLWMDNDSLVLFSANTDRHPQKRIYSFNINSAEIKAISYPKNENFGDFYPSRTQDENEFAFIRAMSESSVFSYSGPGNCKILKQNLKTGKSIEIAEFQGGITDMGFDQLNRSFFIWEVENFGKSKLWSVNDFGIKSLKNLLNDGLPGQISIDSKGHLFYEKWTSGSDVVSFKVVNGKISGNEKEFINSTKMDWGLRFSQLSDKIAFISSRSGRPQVWFASSQNPLQAKQITTFKDELIQSISLSPKGQFLLIHFTHNSSEHIMCIRSNGKIISHFSSDKIGFSNPEWSQSEDYFYYGSNKSNGKWNIYKRNLSGDFDSLISTMGGVRALEDANSNMLYIVKKDAGTIFRLTPKGEYQPVTNSPYMNPQNYVIDSSGIYFLSWSSSTCYLKYCDFDMDSTIIIKPVNNVLPGIPSLSLKPNSKILFVSKSNEIGADILRMSLNE